MIGRIPGRLDSYLLTIEQFVQLNSSFTEKSSVNISLGKLTKNRLQIRKEFGATLEHLSTKKIPPVQRQPAEPGRETNKRAYEGKTYSHFLQ